MLKNPGKLKILNVGDIHFFHDQTPTKHIIDNLNRYLVVKDILKDVDLLTIAGDVFDCQVPYDDPRVGEVERWITHLLRACAACNVVVRVVEGTPSHDRRQSDVFNRQAEALELDVDVKWVSTLSIEHIDKLGIDILYVPDKWNPISTEDTYQQVLGLLKQHGLQSVHVALMHGAFEYQLPVIVKEPAHDSEKYQKIVKFLIFIGHVHVSMPRDRIVPSGSFDRLTHGEEGDKGFHLATVDVETGDFYLTFIKNLGAKIYKTVDLRSGLESEVWDTAKALVEKYPLGSSFNFKTRTNDSVTKAISEIRKAFSGYSWKISLEKSKKEKDEEMEAALEANMEVLPDLTPDVIRQLVKEILLEKEIEPTALEEVDVRLEEILSE